MRPLDSTKRGLGRRQNVKAQGDLLTDVWHIIDMFAGGTPTKLTA
jgi:hypothetical protein